MSYFENPDYGITKTLEGVDHQTAITRTKEALAEVGFGVLTTIDIKKTLKEKIDANHRNYTILGACSPGFAHQALQAVPSIGLLLPCNVVVTEDDDGNAIVSALNPIPVFGLINRPDIESVATEVKARLQKAVDSL